MANEDITNEKANIYHFADWHPSRNKHALSFQRSAWEAPIINEGLPMLKLDIYRKRG